jgi:hypothetical protein
MYKCLLILQCHIYCLCFVQSIIVSYFDFDKVVALPICLREPSEDALGAVSTLAAVAVELVLPSLMLRAHPIVPAPLRHVHSLMGAHNLGYLVIHEEVTWFTSHHHHILRLVNFQVAVVAEVSCVVLAELGRLIRAGNTQVHLIKD